MANPTQHSLATTPRRSSRIAKLRQSTRKPPTPRRSRPLFYLLSHSPARRVQVEFEACRTIQEYRDFLKQKLSIVNIIFCEIKPALIPIGLEPPRTYAACDKLLRQILGMVYDLAAQGDPRVSLEGKTTSEVASEMIWFLDNVPRSYRSFALLAMNMERCWFEKAEVQVPQCFLEMEVLMGQLGVRMWKYWEVQSLKPGG
ncbi:hypothetical protein BJ508DRAFT_334139 [Ascobolus immersus RN42]|uniref:Uncharacterized protein n=1 Tax=Ascobolus immersus RN42 TaxID=1160509 RepID=A0A3N4HMR9_ASCIM|nr:hypothetical protein BJ508DRAFT_334139 [Ascobolus immersus RN42]